MFYVTFQKGSREKPDRDRGPLDQPKVNTPCGRQSTGWGWGYPSPRTASGVPLSSQQEQLQPSFQGVSCDRMLSGPPASWHALAGCVAESGLLCARSCGSVTCQGRSCLPRPGISLALRNPGSARLRAPLSLLGSPVLASGWKKAPEGAALMSPVLPAVWSLYLPASLWHLFPPWWQWVGALESQATITGSASSTFQATELKSCGESREWGEDQARAGRDRTGVALRALQDR